MPGQNSDYSHSQTLRSCIPPHAHQPFVVLYLHLVNVTMPPPNGGHRHTDSVSQNHKAQLASAYNELGKELSSSKIRVVGNYTLGKAIGEGTHPLPWLDHPLVDRHQRGLWQGTHRRSPSHRYPGCNQANPKGHVRLSHKRDSPPQTAPPSPRYSAIRSHRNRVEYLARHRTLLWRRALRLPSRERKIDRG